MRPNNPTKTTRARAVVYLLRFSNSSALDPKPRPPLIAEDARVPALVHAVHAVPVAKMATDAAVAVDVVAIPEALNAGAKLR